MAITLSQLVYDITASVEGTVRLSDDSGTSFEWIAFKVDMTRNTLIRQDQSKGRSLSTNITQNIPCLEVISVSQSECPCTVPSDCTIHRTKDKVPKPIELYQNDLITHISGVNILAPSITFISYARVLNSGLNKVTKKSSKAFLYNGYIYIINAPIGLKIVSINGVFESPRELSKFSTCSGQSCWSDETSEYPVSGYMVNAIKELVIKDLMLTRQIPEDVEGNERDDKPKAQQN